MTRFVMPFDPLGTPTPEKPVWSPVVQTTRRRALNRYFALQDSHGQPGQTADDRVTPAMVARILAAEAAHTHGGKKMDAPRAEALAMIRKARTTPPPAPKPKFGAKPTK